MFNVLKFRLRHAHVFVHFILSIDYLFEVRGLKFEGALEDNVSK